MKIGDAIAKPANEREGLAAVGGNKKDVTGRLRRAGDGQQDAAIVRRPLCVGNWIRRQAVEFGHCRRIAVIGP